MYRKTATCNYSHLDEDVVQVRAILFARLHCRQVDARLHDAQLVIAGNCLQRAGEIIWRR